MKLKTKCEVCNDSFSKYRCPVCVMLYCSVQCYQNHKKDQNCIQKNLKSLEPSKVSVKTDLNFDDDEQISVEKLNLLQTSLSLKHIITNPHLRKMLNTLDNAENKKSLMEEYMHEPIFVEFANECLSIVRNT